MLPLTKKKGIGKVGKKIKNKVTLDFIGHNANGVTGSATLCSFYDYKLGRDVNILIECGGKQDGSIYDNYKANRDTLEKINAKEIDYILLGHAHIDHSFLLPAIVKRGFTGKIMTTRPTARLCKELWYDSHFIMDTECKWLTSKRGIKAKPFYVEGDIGKTIDMLYECELNKEHELTPCIKIKLIPNRHILGSCSIEIYFKGENSHIKKLFYTSDLGNANLEKHFVYPTQFDKINANVVICESTYGNKSREPITKKLRKNELKLMEKTIKDTLLRKQGHVLFPAFSLDRTQNILCYLKDIFQRNEELSDCQVIVDGRLTSKITEVYRKVLDGEDLEKLNQLLSWKNLRIIHDFRVTSAIIADKKPKIVLSSSGFIQNGHIIEYCKSYVKSERNTIIFTGYSPEGSIASKLKKHEQEYIKIENSNYRLKCETLELKSFSSHIQHDQIINLLTNSKITDKIILVHGENEARNCLREELKESLANVSKTTNISVPKRNTSIVF